MILPHVLDNTKKDSRKDKEELKRGLEQVHCVCGGCDAAFGSINVHISK